MFKKSEERKEMLKELSLILNHNVKFTAFFDGIFNYEAVINDVKYCFSIISNDAFVSEMSIEWLLELKNVTYFESSIYVLDKINGWGFAGSKTYCQKLGSNN